MRCPTEHRPPGQPRRHVWLPLIVAGLVSLVVAACETRDSSSSSDFASPDGGSIPLSTSGWRPGDDAFLMGIRGTLRLSDDGCLHLQGRNEAALDVVWPAGWTARRTVEGKAELLDEAGDVVAHTGQQINAGGAGGATFGRYLVCRVPGSTGIAAVEGTIEVGNEAGFG